MIGVAWRDERLRDPPSRRCAWTVQRGNLPTSSFSRWMFSYRLTENGFGIAGGGAFAAAGVKASASTRIFSRGRYTITNASLWPLPWIGWISMARRPSVSTCLSRERLEHRGLLRLLEPIGLQRVRRGPCLLVVRPVHLVRDDRRAFVHVGAQTARVIEVRVGVDQVLDRLVRDESPSPSRSRPPTAPRPAALRRSRCDRSDRSRGCGACRPSGSRRRRPACRW